jgi:hypothetical protein
MADPSLAYDPSQGGGVQSLLGPALYQAAQNIAAQQAAAPPSAPAYALPPGMPEPREALIPGLLDHLLLNGAVDKIRHEQWQAQMANQARAYSIANMNQYLHWLSPADQGPFILAPDKFIQMQIDAGKPMDLAPKHTAINVLGPNGQRTTVTAPDFGITDAGDAYTQGPGGIVLTGQVPTSVTEDASGNLTDKRGNRVGTVPVLKGLDQFWTGGASGPGVVQGAQSVANPQPQMMQPGASGPGVVQGAQSVANPQPQMMQPGVSGRLARSERNNNHGLVTGTGWLGQIGTDPDGFAIFDTMAHGDRAMDLNLQAYGAKHGINTVEALVDRWANTSSPQDRAAYAMRIRNALGIQPGGHIDLGNAGTRAKIEPVIANVEAGHNVTFQPYSVASQVASNAPFDPNNPGASDNRPRPGTIIPGAQGPMRIGPNGLPEPVPNTPGWKDLNEQAAQWRSGDEVGAYTSANKALSALYYLSTGDRTGIAPEHMAQLDAFLKGISSKDQAIRQGAINGMLNELGLQGEIKSEFLKAANQGFLPQDVIRNMYRVTWENANQARQQAIQRAQGITDTARRYNYDPRDFNMTLAPMAKIPKIAQDNVPPPAQRVVGQSYWTPTGRYVWTGKPGTPWRR